MRLRASFVALFVALIVAGCGSSTSSSPSSNRAQDLTVSAAASLTKAFTVYGNQFSSARVRYSFAGSDQLAAQIRAGVKPDVFASANTKLPLALYRSHLVGRPVVFASNELVIAVPASSSAVHSIADLERGGKTIAIGTPTVPVGDYTRKVLARVTPSQRKAILANVRSNEPDVTGIVAKLTQGAADAGFLYRTDVAATDGKLKAIALPAALEPRVAYGAAVVNGSPHAALAAQFIAGLLYGAGQRALSAAGFLPPPRR